MGSERVIELFTLRSSAQRMPTQGLEREAAGHWAAALAELVRPREPGQRDRYRSLLHRTIEAAEASLAAAEREPLASAGDLSESQQASLAVARLLLVKAHAARAEDALHGANQLSLSAQRAPTREACDEGWQHVQAIAAVAEESAVIAAAQTLELENDAARPALVRAARAANRKAITAAQAARRLLEGRNSSYTFHTDTAFSFGEGWYVAAAGVLGGISIQIEPGTPGTAHAERFLRDAGLSSQVRAYRSRPCAMKHTTQVVAQAFRADPISAQRRVRAAFLGERAISSSVVDWVERRLARFPEAVGTKKVLVWVRDGVHHPGRNTRFPELLELVQCVLRSGLMPILTGDAISGGEVPLGGVDMILFWKDPIFRQEDMRRAQLHFFEYLRQRHGLVGQLGVTTAGMDGPALIGLPTMYLTSAPNVRMREWVGAVPGYEEVLRENGYLEHITRRLTEWALGGCL